MLGLAIWQQEAKFVAAQSGKHIAGTSFPTENV